MEIGPHRGAAAWSLARERGMSIGRGSVMIGSEGPSMLRTQPWKLGAIGAMTVVGGMALLSTDWNLEQLIAFVVMLFVARGTVHLAGVPGWTGLSGAMSALYGGGEIAVGLVLLVNLCALLLLIVPGVNIGVFFVANAYLLSREFFELAAMRFRPIEEARALRKRHSLRVFLCGLFLACVVFVPILNLITPVFATAFMVRMHKKISAEAAGRPAIRASAPVPD